MKNQRIEEVVLTEESIKKYQAIQERFNTMKNELDQAAANGITGFAETEKIRKKHGFTANKRIMAEKMLARMSRPLDL